MVSALGATDALITKVAAIPWETSSSTDWMVSTGVVIRGAMAGSNAVRTPWGPAEEPARLVWAGGGPMVNPAESFVPSL